MDLYISIKDLGFLILFIAGLTSLVFLSVVLIKLNKFISNLNNLLDSNRQSIDKTLEQLPETVSNVNEAIVEVRGTANKATSLIDGVGDTLSEAAASVEDSYTQYIEVFKNIINIFMKVKELLK